MSSESNVSKQLCGEACYRVIARIASGSFCDVLRVNCSSDTKDYAVKVLKYGIEQTMDKIIQREIHVLTQLKHKNIISLTDLFTAESPNVIWVVMDYADIGNLEEYVEMTGSLPDEVFLSFTKQICTALDYMHSMDYAHGDVTPRNVFLTSDMVLKLGDFGQTSNVKDDDGREVHCDQFLGDPRYLAPEVLKKASYRAKPADIWSLGCCVYFMFTSKHLFSGSEKDIKQCHLRDKVTFPGERFYYEKYCYQRDLIKCLIIYNPMIRKPVNQILNHQLFHITLPSQGIEFP